MKTLGLVVVLAMILGASSLGAQSGGGQQPKGECVDPHAGPPPSSPDGCGAGCSLDTCDAFQIYDNFYPQYCEETNADCVLGAGPPMTLNITRYRCNTDSNCANPFEIKCFLTVAGPPVQWTAASCP